MDVYIYGCQPCKNTSKPNFSVSNGKCHLLGIKIFFPSSNCKIEQFLTILHF